MAKGPDPRTTPARPEEIPALLRAGGEEWNAHRFWHAHEAWESAWHGLRAAGDAEAAEFLHGLILCAAALENATRGKEAGFKRQMAEGLYLMRTHQEGAPRIGLSWRIMDGIGLLYVDACRRLDWSTWAARWEAPRVEWE